MGNSGRFPPKESQLQQSRATQPLLITKCTLVFFRVCVIHPNSDMDYTICNVQDVIILLRVHTGAGHTDDDVRVSTTSLTRKKVSQFCLVLLAGFELRVFGSRVGRSTN